MLPNSLTSDIANSEAIKCTAMGRLLVWLVCSIVVPTVTADLEYHTPVVKTGHLEGGELWWMTRKQLEELLKRNWPDDGQVAQHITEVTRNPNSFNGALIIGAIDSPGGDLDYQEKHGPYICKEGYVWIKNRCRKVSNQWNTLKHR